MLHVESFLCFIPIYKCKTVWYSPFLKCFGHYDFFWSYTYIYLFLPFICGLGRQTFYNIFLGRYSHFCLFHYCGLAVWRFCHMLASIHKMATSWWWTWLSKGKLSTRILCTSSWDYAQWLTNINKAGYPRERCNPEIGKCTFNKQMQHDFIISII